MFEVSTLFTLHRCRSSRCCQSANLHLSRLVVTAPLTSNNKQQSSHSSHDADLVDLHTLVAEHGDFGHGAVKSDSLMEQGVVGQDKARRGQPVAKPVAPPVWHREWHEDREHEQHRERGGDMLARVKEFDGDIDIGIESNLSKLEFDQECDQELKHRVAKSRRVLRRESLRAWLRVQVCLRESLQGSCRVWIREWIREWIRVWARMR